MAVKNKYDKQHLRNIQRYSKQIESIYDAAAKEAAAISGIVSNFDPSKPFSFVDYPITKHRLDKLLSNVSKQAESVIINGIKAEWEVSNIKNDELVRDSIDKIWMGKRGAKNLIKNSKRYFQNNERACEAFIARKEQGLDLSDRVWKYADQFKQEIEMGIDIGLRDGKSAEGIGRYLRQYLQQPDKLFRRVRDKHGQLHLSKKAAAYHPGAGMYRSSRKNALRLARTETNIAYRTSDFIRWQQLDFVVGIEIKASNNHPAVDICDSLNGKYPKDFKFSGWHPQCFCYAIPILKTMEEMQADNERMMNGEQVVNESTNSIRNVPGAYNSWIDDNRQRISATKSMPYFIRDNKQYNKAIFEVDKPIPVGAITLKQIDSYKQNTPFAMTGEYAQKLKNDGWEFDKEVKDLVATFNESPMSGFDIGEFAAEFTNTFKNAGISISTKRLYVSKNKVKLYLGDGDQVALARTFTITDGRKNVTHDLFVLPDALQGKGISKEVFQSMYKQYQKSGVKTIDVYANIDVGGYTWGRYGFSAKREEASYILKARMRKNAISEPEFNKAVAIMDDFYSVNSKDAKFPMNLLADQEYGNKLLLGTNWEGFIDFDNITQRKAFEKYLYR